MTYCRLWQGLLDGDTDIVKHNCQALNAGKLYPLLAGMVSARLWDSIARAKVQRGHPSSTEVSRSTHIMHLYLFC